MNLLGLTISLALLAATAAAQAPRDSRTTAAHQLPKSNKLPIAPLGVGTAFNAALITSLDAGHNRAGDTFTAKVTETVTYQRTVIFAKDTLLIGHLVRTSLRDGGREGAALFLQFDKAILTNGEQTLLVAGIQALAPGRDAPWQTEIAVRPAQYDPADSEDVPELASIRQPRRSDFDLGPLPVVQGAFTHDGLLTSDSQGALGMPGVKIYTPVAEGSNGSVLLCDTSNLRLEPGTRLLVVIQPPPPAPKPLR